MQIHNNTLITECSAYDFKEMLEHKKVKSWLKSVSAFANTDGGSLFYGVNDDGVIVGLENPQADADFISEMIKARLDPVPEVQLIPIEHEGHTLIEVKVKAGTLTPYYYYQDGTRTAYTLLLNHKLNNKPMGTSFIPLSAIIAVLIIAFLFASLPHVNHKTRYRVLHNDLYNLLISDLGT